jgi:hypothetical protein
LRVVAYFSYEDLDTGEYDGVLRLSADHATFERASSKDGWVEDPTLMRHLVNPGANGPDLIPLEKARELADRYAVEL